MLEYEQIEEYRDEIRANFGNPGPAIGAPAMQIAKLQDIWRKLGLG